MDSRIGLLIAMSRLHDDIYAAACAQHARTVVALTEAPQRRRRAPRQRRRVRVSRTGA